jgi:hypothetical protein
MPRNEARPLIPSLAARQRRNVEALEGRTDTVTVRYIKRDDTESSTTGTVKFFNGRVGYDTGSVTIDDPAKGARTINLHRIYEIE